MWSSKLWASDTLIEVSSGEQPNVDVGIPTISTWGASTWSGQLWASGGLTAKPTIIHLTATREKVNVASTVIISLNAPAVSDVTINLSSDNTGIFSSNSVIITAGNTQIAVTYTANVAGIHNLSTTNSESLTNSSISLKSDSLAYYISSSGVNSNVGFNSSSPWQSWDAVEAWGLVRGATYYFNGGNTFTKQINIADGITGSNLQDKITLTSYGTGKAIINNTSATTNPIQLIRSGGVTIDNLIVSGAGKTPTLSSQNLVNVLKDFGNDLYNITITNCIFRNAKIAVNTNPNGAGTTTGRKLHGFIFENNEAYDLWSRAVNLAADYDTPGIDHTWITEVSIKNNLVYNIDNTIDSSSTPCAFVIAFCDSPEISYNLIHDMGGVSPLTANVIFTWGNVDKPWIHHNEIYNVIQNGGGDAGGPNFDSGTRNGICEFNYIHNCGGAGLQAYAYSAGTKPSFVGSWSNNHYRFNVVQNCGGASFGSFSALGDSLSGIKVYNNTFVVPTTARAALDYGAWGFSTSNVSGSFYNNIFYIRGSTPIIDFQVGTGVAANQDFKNNLYYMADSGAVTIKWFGTTYNNIGSWGKDSNAVISNPQMVSPTTETIFNNPNQIGTLPGIKLTSTSVANNAGVNLTEAPYNYTGITTDFSGNSFPSSGWSIGAVDYIESTGTASGTLAGLVLSILTATPSSYTDSSATGALPQLTLSTLTATISVSSGAVASGSFQQINLSVVTGTASSETGQINSSSSGAFSNIMLSTLSGTASYEGQYPNVIQDFGPKTIQIIT